MNKTTEAVKHLEAYRKGYEHGRFVEKMDTTLAEPVKQKEAELAVEPVGHVLSDGTICWDRWCPEAGALLYAAPVGAEHFLKAIAALREGIATCRAEALEEAAKVCDEEVKAWARLNAQDEEGYGATQCAAAIRGLK